MSSPQHPPREKLLPIKVEFTVTGRSAPDLEEKASMQMGAFAAGREWRIDILDAKPYLVTQGQLIIVSWQAEVVGRVGST